MGQVGWHRRRTAKKSCVVAGWSGGRGKGADLDGRGVGALLDDAQEQDGHDLDRHCQAVRIESVPTSYCRQDHHLHHLSHYSEHLTTLSRPGLQLVALVSI